MEQTQDIRQCNAGQKLKQWRYYKHRISLRNSTAHTSRKIQIHGLTLEKKDQDLQKVNQPEEHEYLTNKQTEAL